ncbi:MAG: long-chain fatty acid--CoA ligase, partial [Candidatus Binatia bacterium]|nr:long-chain fatty acid--CoA ligase [Candidatus Binatia bacterium]
MSIEETVAGQTLATSFLATVAEHGPEEALRWKNDDGSYGSWTFDEYAELVARVAGGLSRLGIGHGDRLVLMMR